MADHGVQHSNVRPGQSRQRSLASSLSATQRMAGIWYVSHFLLLQGVGTDCSCTVQGPQMSGPAPTALLDAVHQRSLLQTRTECLQTWHCDLPTYHKKHCLNLHRRVFTVGSISSPTPPAASSIMAGWQSHVEPIMSWLLFGSHCSKLAQPSEINCGPWPSTHA